MIKLELKESSNIQGAYYEPLTGSLYVDFHNGKYRYEYIGVSIEVVNCWLESESVGKYLCANIKNRYPFIKHEAKLKDAI